METGDTVEAHVDELLRDATRRNHTATHLLHWALKEVVSGEANQKGSLVDPERLRFDFSHFEPVTTEQLQQIETMVNDYIRGNAEVETRLMSMDEAMESGAIALFGEKYEQQVRVVGDRSDVRRSGACLACQCRQR